MAEHVEGTFFGTLVVPARGILFYDVQASEYGSPGNARLTFFVSPSVVWLDDVVELIVSQPEPRRIVALVVAHVTPKTGDDGDRFDARILSDDHAVELQLDHRD